MKPTVSINLCVFNGENYLREALGSIVSQTYKDWELVVINDGSSDSTEAIVYEFINRGYPIVYRYQENKGLGYSRNEALKRSQGEYIAFIDHDDTWMLQKLEKQMGLFHTNPKVGLVYSDCYFAYPDGKKVLGSKFFNFRRGHVFKEMLAGNFIVLSTAVVRKDLVNEFGGFPHYSVAEEFALFLKIAYEHPVDFIDEPLVKYRYHEGNVSKDLETNLKETKEILGYWSQHGEKEIRRISKSAMGKAHYGLSRRALFHLKDKGQAKSLIKGSFKYEMKLKYCVFWGLCFFPHWMVQRLRKFALILLTISHR